MTKKDYQKLAEVFNRKASIKSSNSGHGEEYEKGWNESYHSMLGRIMYVLRADNPRFNADKFMNALE